MPAWCFLKTMIKKVIKNLETLLSHYSIHRNLQENQERINETFRFLLKKEFWFDLCVVMSLVSLPKYDLSSEQKNTMHSLRDKYRSGNCPSYLFKCVSRDLQEEYYTIQGIVSSFLYS